MVDPLPQFRQQRDQIETLYIPYDRHHPTALGHQLVAEVIFNALKGRGTDHLSEQ